MKFPKSEQVVEHLQSASGKTEYVITKSTKDPPMFTLWKLEGDKPVKVDKHTNPKALRQIWLDEVSDS